MWRVEKSRPVDRPGEGARCLADDNSAHAISDKVDGGAAFLQLIPQCGTFLFQRRPPRVVIAPDPAGAYLGLDAAPQALPSGMVSQEPFQNECRRRLIWRALGVHKSLRVRIGCQGSRSPVFRSQGLGSFVRSRSEARRARGCHAMPHRPEAPSGWARASL